jgi:peptidoglycan/LPS O-acetylase OafA/YrhL
LISRLETTWHWKLALPLALLGATLAACALLRIDWSNGAFVAVAMFPPARLFEFVLGMTAALAFRQYGSRFRPGRTIGTLIEVAALALVVLAAYWAPSFVNARPLVAWWAVCGSPAIPAALLIFVTASGAGSISRALAIRPLECLGEISYSVYLLHAILLAEFARHRFPLGDGAVSVAYLVALMAASVLMWSLIEKPMRKALMTIGASNRAPTPILPGVSAVMPAE